MQSRSHSGLDRLQIGPAVLTALRKDAGEQLVYFPRHFLMDRSSRFFSCSVQPPALLLHRAEPTDFFVEGHQVLAELLEAVKLGDLLLRFAQGGGIGKAFRYRFAGHAAGEAELGIVPRVVVLGAVAGGLAAAPGHGGNGTRTEITQAEELLQELGSLGL